MSVEYIVGNLLNTDCQYLVHQVNCQGAMNSGVAKSIREKWPVVYDAYKKRIDYNTEAGHSSGTLLGEIQMINLKLFGEIGPEVINFFAQEFYGYNGNRYTSYDAFWRCLHMLKKNIAVGSSIAFPGYIGCGRGGANWNIIKTMILEVFHEEDYTIKFYFLDTKEEEK